VVALAGAARARNVTAGTEHLGLRVAHDWTRPIPESGQ